MGDWDVMIIEDDDDTREVLSEILVAEALTVKAVSNAEAGVDLLLAGSTVRLVISDARLPGASGTVFLRMLRASSPLKAIPLVLVSGDAKAVAEAKRLGAEAAFVKPFGIEQLMGTVRKLLNLPARKD